MFGERKRGRTKKEETTHVLIVFGPLCPFELNILELKQKINSMKKKPKEKRQVRLKSVFCCWIDRTQESLVTVIIERERKHLKSHAANSTFYVVLEWVTEPTEWLVSMNVFKEEREEKKIFENFPLKWPTLRFMCLPPHKDIISWTLGPSEIETVIF